MDKSYNHKDFEAKLYEQWEKSGLFNPDNARLDSPATDSKHSEWEFFSIMMPPPNVTGVLHLGHAFENALMDTQARYQRMRGKRVLFLPGTDHAAVATQARVEKELIKSKKYKNPRKELGRDGLLEEIRNYAEESKKTIINQIKKLGASCDWSRLAYTFDDERSAAVNEMFKRMYEDGLIYRGYRVVNWSTKGQSTCSDDEIVHVDRKATLYTFKYSADFPIEIASTRPETKLGDTAVAVHPDDKRYKEFIGKTFDVDFLGTKLRLKVIADEHIDPQFGTGALGVTPAHSQIDYEMYERNKDIGLIQVIDKFGKITQDAGEKFAGLKVDAARELVVEELKKACLLSKKEEIEQSVGTSDRFGDVVEVLPMEQWFVAVNKKIGNSEKTLKDLMKDAVTTGHGNDPEQQVHILPERFQKNYFNWIDNLRDWCISRQIWWGHRIPVWYHGDEMKVSATSPGSDWAQDEDTLDTWFSSGTWTFSTLGWPQKTEELEQFHPTSWMTMGYEILFFWMARMILMSTYALDEIPFRTAYIHGILRDEHGRKFSKSLGNGVDPLEIIDQYGADALRFAVMYGASPGTDQSWTVSHLKGGRHFANKLWNIARFAQMSGMKFDDATPLPQQITDTANKEFLIRLDEAKVQATKHIEQQNFAEALKALHNFAWHEFADKYIERIKRPNGELPRETQLVLARTIRMLLVMLHPFMPFVTEAIWQELGLRTHDTDFLMIQPWPSAK